MSPDGSTRPLPEEKLLKLIREKGPKAAAAATAVTGDVTAALSRGAAALSQGKAEHAPMRWPILAAGALSLVLIVEVGWLLMFWIRPLPAVEIPTVTPPGMVDPVPMVPQPLDVPSLAQSASPALFAPSSLPTDGSKPRTGMSDTAKRLASRLTLMGIMAGDPAQAIIEDTETKKSYFVSTGQLVVEGAVLEQVLENRVILDLDGEKIELSL